jgi:hypothetical protein
MADLICCVCEQPAVAVVNSGLGAWSSAYCAECGRRGAEPLGDLNMMIEVAGLTTDDLADYTTFVDGKYVVYGELKTNG